VNTCAPWDRTISRSRMTLSCCSWLSSLISRMAVMGKPSFSLSMRIFLSATISPVRSSFARYTCTNIVQEV